MSSGGESGSGHGSDFDPEFDGDESPVRGANYPQTANSIGSRRSKEKKAASAKVPTTPTTQSSQPKAKSPTPNSNQPVGSTSQQSSQLQGPFILPGVGGGIPIMLPGQANMTSNERAHLYTFLRQLPLGFARSDGNAGVGTGPLPFPFPITRHPGLMPPASLSNDPIPAAHAAEAPPGEHADSPTRSMSGSPSKSRPEPGTVEWARQRKDNHKEVERRRRGNINEGINELARLIPNGHGDKAKGAVLQRAVQYVKQLKENEQKSAEKWTMEKLLLDQSNEELQRRLRELERLWKDEKAKREELESEVVRLKKLLGETEEDELDDDEEEEERPAKRMRLS